MFTNKRIRLISGIIVILSAHLLAGEYHIVVNSSVENETITAKALKNIFLGKQTKWDSGHRILPAMLQEGDTRNTFVKEIVKKTPMAFKNYWNAALFTGRGVPPATFENNEDLIDYIKNNSGAIGFVSETMSVENVKIIEIQQ